MPVAPPPALAPLLGWVDEAVVGLDDDLRLTYLNGAAERLLGASRTDLLGRPAAEALPEAGGWVAAAGRSALRAEGPVHVEKYFPALGRWLDVRAVRVDGGLAVLAVAASPDPEHVERLGILDAAVEGSLDAVMITAGEWDRRSIVYVNPRFTEITWYPPHEVLGRSPRLLVHPDEAGGAAFRALVETIRAGQPHRMVLRGARRDGAAFWANLSAVPVRDASGALGHWVMMFADVTERVEGDAAQTALIERLERLSRRLVEVQEQERRAVAMDLHDEVGGALTSLKLMCEMIRRHPERAEALAARVAEAAQAAQTHVRSIAMQLRPSILDDIGLAPALEWLGQWVLERMQIAVSLDVDGDLPEFPPEVATAAYRITQESLTNVARHAGVAAATVALRAVDGQLEVVVRDEGVGFDPVGRHQGSAGVSGVVERARLLGGVAWVESAPGEGTTVVARLPIE